MLCLHAILAHPIKSNLDGASVGLEFFHLGQAHDCFAHVAQTLGREVAARDVFDVGAEVDAGVLFGVAVGCCLYTVSMDMF